jgi:hypothetical protein
MRTLVTARHLAIALTGILIGFTLSGAAYAISAAGFRYSAPQTGYLVIGAAAFVPQLSTTTYTMDSGLSLAASSSGCFAAPVNLPHGAKITQVAMWYSKTDVPGGFLLQRVALTDPPSSATVIAEIAPLPTGGVIKSAAVNVTNAPLQTVNNTRYAYAIAQCVSQTETFIGARIKYTYTSAGD